MSNTSKCCKWLSGNAFLVHWHNKKSKLLQRMQMLLLVFSDVVQAASMYAQPTHRSNVLPASQHLYMWYKYVLLAEHAAGPSV